MSKSSDTFFHKIIHVQQRYAWDCGLACLRMVLFGVDNHNLHEDEMNKVLKSVWSNPETNFGKRPWTVDLCNILRCLQVKFTFYTKAVQVNAEEKCGLEFYKTVGQDKTRVDRLAALFRNEVVEKELCTEEVVGLLQEGPLILLVDGNKLECARCQEKKPFWRRMAHGMHSRGRDFLGHYVVLVGYNWISEEFYFRDPAISNEICKTKAEVIEQARLAIGTDQDIIAVKMHGARTAA